MTQTEQEQRPPYPSTQSLSVSLTDIAAYHFSYRDPLTDGPIKYQFDKTLPQLWDYSTVHEGPNVLEGFDQMSLDFAVHSLLEDLCIHGRGSARITTSLVDGDQILWIDHHGAHLRPEKLAYINETVWQVLNGQELREDDTRFGATSMNIAARCLRRFDGKLALMNIDSDGYTMRTEVRIPSGALEPHE